eukprot:scaffold10288_cov154-Isochrysis_galbana.AAC.1
MPLMHLWINHNMSYLDALVLEDFQYHDADFRRDSWSTYTYQNLHMCRLGVCPNPQLAMVPRCLQPFHSHSYNP